jgi:ATP-dependent Clp protease ATP-binding subunit ClpA
MFEHYTERARRAVFFARYEASIYGSPYIESEHLLLGLLREDLSVANRFENRRIVESEVRAKIETRIIRRKRFSTSVAVPLSGECESVLKFAADAAEELGHRLVGTEHLLLGILRADTSLAAQVLAALGLKSEHIYEAMGAPHEGAATTTAQVTLEIFLARLRSVKSEWHRYLIAISQRMRSSSTPQANDGIAKNFGRTSIGSSLVLRRKTQATLLRRC